MKQKKGNKSVSSAKKQKAERMEERSRKMDKRTLLVRILAGIIAFLMIAGVMFSVVGA